MLLLLGASSIVLAGSYAVAPHITNERAGQPQGASVSSAKERKDRTARATNESEIKKPKANESDATKSAVNKLKVNKAKVTKPKVSRAKVTKPKISRAKVNRSKGKVVKATKATLPHPPGELSRYERVEVVATGYTAGYESTGKTVSHPAYGITKSGVHVHRGIYSTIAADPDVFPIGSILYIPGYGYGIVADTGSAIKGNRIDLYFDTVDDVYREWGKKATAVYVLERGSGELTQERFESYNRFAEMNGSY
ncbi:3D domain-containing protein [Numidum massiliense]|uniref:3D domain-containing protein n=1 Tax=Numidum massiliense TaxID=1522315 RepID=UPI001E613534|nr:3D domain-containing protein [Numidum massiliense]